MSMEAKKLEAQIEEWATGLGFTLRDGSSPPPNFFSALTATPNRRQLWKTIVESVQDRRQVELMRKQLFVFYAKQEMKVKSYSDHSKRFPSKLQLYSEIVDLENQIRDQKKENEKLERQIMSKVSDLIFDACKLREKKRESDEYMEKALALRLLNRRQNQHIAEFNEHLAKLVENHVDPIKVKNEYSKSLEELENLKPCTTTDYHDCPIQKKIKEFSDSGVKESSLWQCAVENKSAHLHRFSNFLDEFEDFHVNVLQKKNEDAEKTFQERMEKLKQEITLKSLQVLLNDSEVGLMNKKIEKLVEKSELSTEQKNQLIALKLKTYYEFLKSEISRLNNDFLRKRENSEEPSGGKEEFENTLNVIGCIHQEIEDSLLVQKSQAKEIDQLLDRANNLWLELEEQAKNADFVKRIQNTIENLKKNSRDQFDLFLAAPKEVATIKGVEKLTEPDAYAVDLLPGDQRIFQTLLINPFQSVDSILNQLEERKRAAEVLKKFVANRNKISESLRGLLQNIKSVKGDSEKWENVGEKCQKILSNVLVKVKALEGDKIFVEKILRNWAEQPYRKMIEGSETVLGKTLKEYEKLYKEKLKE